MLNDNLFPPLVPNESPCYVNIYLFIALLSDFLKKTKLQLNIARRRITTTWTRKMTRTFPKHGFEFLDENDDGGGGDVYMRSTNSAS